MINTVNTLGASVPGFNRSTAVERKPDAGSSLAEAKPKENSQSVSALDGGQDLAGSRQVSRSQIIPSVTPTDTADNEPQHRVEDDVSSRRDDLLERRASNIANDEVTVSDRVARNENNQLESQNRDQARAVAKSQASEQRSEKSEDENRRTAFTAAEADVESVRKAEVVEQSEIAARAKSAEKAEVNASAANNASAADNERAALESAEAREDKAQTQSTSFGSVDEARSNDKKESGDANNQATSSSDDPALSRPEKEGLRSFQQIAEVSAFEATGTTIDVSV